MSTLPLAEVRAQLSKIVDDAVRTHERVEITRNGVRAAVMLSADDYDGLMETLDILGDPELLDQIRVALVEEPISTEELLTDLAPARRGNR
jgi:prevent-host-death family protein